MKEEMDKTECNVFGALTTMLRVSRIAGLAPLTFTRKGHGLQVAVSARFVLYGYFVITLMLLSTLVALIKDSNVDPTESFRLRTSTRKIVWISDVVLLSVISGVSVFGSKGRMKAMISCLNAQQKIHSDLNVPHWPQWCEQRKSKLIVVSMLVILVITLLDHVLLSLNFISITDIEYSDAVWITVMYTFYYGLYWIVLLEGLQFIMITLHVFHTFKCINIRLRNLLKELSESSSTQIFLLPLNNNKCFYKNKSSKKMSANAVHSLNVASINSGTPLNSTRFHEEVRRLSSVYTSACKLVREVNTTYGFIVILLLGSCLYHLVITPYYLINNLFERNQSQTSSHRFYMIIQSCWCILHSVSLIFLVEPCHMTHMEVESTQELVSHLMFCTTSVYDPLAVELELFYRHLVLNQVSYSPLRITTMTRPLVAAMFGSITTYLVVVVQL